MQISIHFAKSQKIVFRRRPAQRQAKLGASPPSPGWPRSTSKAASAAVKANSAPAENASARVTIARKLVVTLNAIVRDNLAFQP
jgi:hypothetical protein